MLKVLTDKSSWYYLPFSHTRLGNYVNPICGLGWRQTHTVTTQLYVRVQRTRKINVFIFPFDQRQVIRGVDRNAQETYPRLRSKAGPHSAINYDDIIPQVH